MQQNVEVKPLQRQQDVGNVELCGLKERRKGSLERSGTPYDYNFDGFYNLPG
jgi:hypothetical protein